jgi:hypothetical protein
MSNSRKAQGTCQIREKRWEIDKTGEIRLVEQGAMQIAPNRAELN